MQHRLDTLQLTDRGVSNDPFRTAAESAALKTTISAYVVSSLITTRPYNFLALKNKMALVW
ncbi:hypothetical protein LINGRAHAP2_LOCUS4180 [Linum grandiflorum]